MLHNVSNRNRSRSRSDIMSIKEQIDKFSIDNENLFPIDKNQFPIDKNNSMQQSEEKNKIKKKKQHRYKIGEKKRKKICIDFLNFINRHNVFDESEKNMDFKNLDFFLDNLDLHKAPHQKPTIISEFEYIDKIIMSNLIENFNVNNLFSKIKNKLINGNKFNNHYKNLILNKIKSLKGGNLTVLGDEILRILHIYDAKHDFGSESTNINKYIKDLYLSDSRILIPDGGTTPAQADKYDKYDKLYNDYTSNYEENILNYIISNNDKLIDVDDDNACFMYVDINSSADKYIFFDSKGKVPKQKETFNTDDDELETIIKDYYNYNNRQDIGYLYDTCVHTYSKLDEKIKHIAKNVLNKFSNQLYPFENAYDPHSSSVIDIPMDMTDIYRNITDTNFNRNNPNNQHLSAIRDMTREYLNFNVREFTIDGINKTYINIKLNKLNTINLNELINNLSSSTTTTSLIGSFYLENIKHNLTVINTAYVIKKYNIIIHLSEDNCINIACINSFNTISLIKNCIENIMSASDLANMINIYNLDHTKDIAPKWLLYFIVIYLIFTNPKYEQAKTNQQQLKNIKNNVINILLDLKKSGDWSQSLFCSLYNEQENSEKECFFISGDKLSAARSILNGNVKTITATDYYNLQDTAASTNAPGKKTKKCILTLFNGKSKLKFTNLNSLLIGGIFNFNAFRLNYFNFTNIINAFKNDSSINDNTFIEDDNLNFDYFWKFIIIIIYQMRIYYNSFSVFKTIDTNNFDLIDFTDVNRFEIKNIPERRVAASANPFFTKIFRNFTDADIKYKICQFNPDIFIQSRLITFNYDLDILFKLIESDITYNDTLDNNYIEDILYLCTSIFDITLPPYNKSNSLYHYLIHIYMDPANKVKIMNNNKIIKFLRKICQLNRLCQLLYIDNNTTKQNNISDLHDMLIKIRESIAYNAANPPIIEGDEDEDEDEEEKKNEDEDEDDDEYKRKRKKQKQVDILPAIQEVSSSSKIDTSKSTSTGTGKGKGKGRGRGRRRGGAITSSSDVVLPKTIVKDYIEKFYDDVCVLIHNFQDNTVNIGDNIYMDSTNMMMQALNIITEDINKDKEILEKVENILRLYENLNKQIDEYNKPRIDAEKIKNIPNILLQFTNYTILKNGYNRIGNDGGNINIIFENYYKIYKAVVNIIPDIDIEDPEQATKNINYLQLMNDYQLYAYINILDYQKLLSQFNEFLKDEDIINYIKQEIDKLITDAQIKTKLLTYIDNINNIVNYYTTVLNPNQDTYHNLIYNNNILVNALSEIYDFVENAKIRGKKTLIKEKFSFYRNKINEYFMSKISEDLYDYFNTVILSYYQLLDIYKIPSFDRKLANQFQQLLFELVTLPNINSDYFDNVNKESDTSITINSLHGYLIDKINKSTEYLNIIISNLHYIYKVNPESTPEEMEQEEQEKRNKLQIPARFSRTNIFFKEDVKDLVLLSNAREPVMQSRRSKPANSSGDISKEQKQVLTWYKSPRTYNVFYDVMNSSSSIEDDKIKFLMSRKKTVKSKLTIKAIDDIFLFRSSTRFSQTGTTIDEFFQNVGFILNISKILKEFITEAYENLSNIMNIIDNNNNLKIATVITNKKNYYNEDKFKIIDIITNYINVILAEKVKGLFNVQSLKNKYRFDKVFKNYFKNPQKEIDSILKSFDIVNRITRSDPTNITNVRHNLSLSELTKIYDKNQSLYKEKIVSNSLTPENQKVLKTILKNKQLFDVNTNEFYESKKSNRPIDIRTKLARVGDIIEGLKT